MLTSSTRIYDVPHCATEQGELLRARAVLKLQQASVSTMSQRQQHAWLHNRRTSDHSMGKRHLSSVSVATIQHDLLAVTKKKKKKRFATDESPLRGNSLRWL